METHHRLCHHDVMLCLSLLPSSWCCCTGGVLSLVDYMSQVFANVNWVPWLLLMMTYSCLYLAIDTLVVARSLKWFVKEIPYRDILPIRASAYIISIFNEQIGKGAMAYYLNKRDGVPGWEVGSVMLFIMFCEMFYLLAWATIGFVVSRETLPEGFGLIPPIAFGCRCIHGALDRIFPWQAFAQNPTT
ncbi:MAG: hypothetical protein CM1200mP14_14080 [Gammaproteobacteria bacterium]|nr:MAG: hypothetical protein CM1200mP14_14080 [Gammaproteobacteria bacterium]